MKDISIVNPLPVAILAGGLATRMRPMTYTRPKALIEVAGQPFIARQLAYLRDQGIRRVVLCVGYLGKQIQTVVGSGAAWELSVDYSFDGNTLLGTGGALYKALPLLGETFFVLYGDSFLPCDFSVIAADFLAQSKPALMTLLENHNVWDKSNVLYREGVILEYNKAHPRPDMTFIDYGLGLLSSSVFNRAVKDQALDLAALYHQLSLEGKLAGKVIQERFYEIGSQKGLVEAEDYFLKKDESCMHNNI